MSEIIHLSNVRLSFPKLIEEKLMANVAVGQEAPDFTLKNESNQDVKLSSLRGKPAA